MESLMKKLTLITGSLAIAMLIVTSFGPNLTLTAQTPAPQQATPPAAAMGPSRGGERPTPAPPPPAVMPAPVTPIVSMTAPSPDPRVGLKAGRWDAAQAAWNMRM